MNVEFRMSNKELLWTMVYGLFSNLSTYLNAYGRAID
jgi:hypothetical protein